MYSSNGPIVDIDINKLKTTKYRCLNCREEFKGMGEKIICPYCKSKHIKKD